MPDPRRVRVFMSPDAVKARQWDAALVEHRRRFPSPWELALRRACTPGLVAALSSSPVLRSLLPLPDWRA